MNGEDRYEDIIGKAYPFKTIRTRMSLHDRAAQFSPFAALTGYDALIGETERLTDSRIELDESEKAGLDRTLAELRAGGCRKLSVTYFLRDARKEGGAYLTLEGVLKGLDEMGRAITLVDGKVIPVDDIISLKPIL